jgi:hypothetical protein
MTGWDRLRQRLPEEWAQKLADRLEQLERTNTGALLELSIYVSKGAIVELRWDPDEKIRLTQRRREV